MDFNLSVFQEPRGVMRILHLIFSICAFATITGYTGVINYDCGVFTDLYIFSYPFDFILNKSYNITNTVTCDVTVVGVSSSDAQFFVTTGVLAMLYCIAIILVYTKFDEMYKTNTKIPLYDFLITVVFGVLWLSSSAAWANGLSGLKAATSNPHFGTGCTNCKASSNYSTLNISVIFGFLNFFLWAADLWFVYKETTWFQGNQPRDTEGV